MGVVIRVENVSKQYRLGTISRRMLYQDVQSGFARMLGRPDPHEKITEGGAARPAIGGISDYLWALREVSFDVNEGDVVGIIGRNGSGKSTLLKILSRITAPTEGRVFLKGRVACLLEVGTGFHPELTGRDNIYLNGSILGMTRAEITRKFDEIVDFSGVEKFIDTPVKRYSSGMTVRLAFAVAANLEPEILVIDEVLAVGDAAFQKKCLGKMSAVAREGRTILFVSHQSAAVENLCSRGIMLEGGGLRFDGTQTEALRFYANSTGNYDGLLRDRTDRKGTGDIRITAIEFRDTRGNRINTMASGQDVDVLLYFENITSRPWPNLLVSITVKNQLDVPVFIHGNLYTGDTFGESIPSSGAFVCRLHKLPLPTSAYRLDFLIRSQARGAEVLDWMDSAIEMPVEGGDFFGSGQVPPMIDGICLADGSWRLTAETTPDAAEPQLVPG